MSCGHPIERVETPCETQSENIVGIVTSCKLGFGDLARPKGTCTRTVDCSTGTDSGGLGVFQGPSKGFNVLRR